MQMDIDIVVLWVDGNDPAWQAEKNRYSPKKIDNSNAANRYRDWNLMPYWFRAIEAFTPWVRTVHFVTWGHLPSFLNADNPRLHIVRHEDYMPPEALPCFNSCALEMNLHRIKGLAERFVYLNDDVFIIRPMEAGKFFNEKTGLPCNQFGEMPCYLKGALNPHEVSVVRDVGLINKWFDKKKVSLLKYPGKYCSTAYPLIENVRNVGLKLLYSGYYTGFRSFHAASAFMKSSFEEVWEKEPELLMQTTKEKFRSYICVNQYLPLWWQLASGKFSPVRISADVKDTTPANLPYLCDLISGQKRDMLCLNDPSEEVDFESVSEQLRAAFEKILPEKSSFEI